MSSGTSFCSFSSSHLSQPNQDHHVLRPQLSLPSSSPAVWHSVCATFDCVRYIWICTLHLVVCALEEETAEYNTFLFSKIHSYVNYIIKDFLCGIHSCVKPCMKKLSASEWSIKMKNSANREQMQNKANLVQCILLLSMQFSEMRLNAIVFRDFLLIAVLRSTAQAQARTRLDWEEIANFVNI